MDRNKIFFTLFILTFLVKMAFAQNGFYIQNGGSVIVKNNATITLNNTKLVNNATFSASNGTLNIVGNATNENSAIEGSGTTTLEHLTIDKSSNSVQLNQNIAITGNLTLRAGGLELNNGSVDFGTTGSLQSETATNRVFGTGGQLMATADLNVPTNSNPANLGAEITSTQNLGVTLIKRGHTEFSNTSNSVLRYFDISPTNNTSLNASLRYHYFETELNGNVENSLNLWRSTDAGVTWTEQTNTTRNIANNQAEVTGITAFSRWTAAVAGALCNEPTAFNITGGGTFCKGLAGIALGLSDSEIDVNYQLLLNNVAIGSPIAGTGDVISFGNQTENGTYTVVATSVGACMATMTGSQTVTTDETLPAFTLATVPVNVTVDCNNIPSAATVTATNVCSTVTMTSISTQGTDNTNCNFYNYTITRTWTATDKRNNTASVSQIITVKNNGTTSIGPFSAVTVSESGIPQTLTVTATSCMPAPIVSYVDIRVNNSLSNCYAYNYTLNRIWSLTDICGNTNSATQAVIVKGITITCPSDKTIYTNSDGTGNYNCSTIVKANDNVSPTFLDNCNISILKYTLSGATTGNGNGSIAGLSLNKGITAVTYGLQVAQVDVCSFTVTVNDNEAPKFGTIGNTILDACNIPSPITMTAPSVSDNCSGNVTLTPSMDVTATVSGCASKAATLKYTKSVTRTWIAADVAGNTSTAVQRMFLRDMQAPTAICKDFTVNIGSSNVTVLATQINNGSNDNCTATAALSYAICRNIGLVCTYASVLSLTPSMIPTGSNFVNIPVTLRVTDACGNNGTCTATIRLQRVNSLTNGNKTMDLSITSDSAAEAISSEPAIPSTIDATHGSLKCFPNPFSDNLNLEYNLAKAATKVTLKVYDNQGRLVMQSEQGEQLEGFYQINWNLSHLQAGMYHVCLEIDGKQKNIERVIRVC